MLFGCWLKLKSGVSVHEHQDENRTQALTSPSSNHHFPKLPNSPSPTSGERSNGNVERLVAVDDLHGAERAEVCGVFGGGGGLDEREAESFVSWMAGDFDVSV